MATDSGGVDKRQDKSTDDRLHDCVTRHRETVIYKLVVDIFQCLGFALS